MASGTRKFWLGLSVIYTYDLHTSNRVCMFSMGKLFPLDKILHCTYLLNDLNKAESAFIRNEHTKNDSLNTNLM